MHRQKVFFGIIWIALTILYYFVYDIVNQFLDVMENGFGLINTTVSLLPFFVAIFITYVLIHLLALRQSYKILWMITLSILLSVPTSQSVIKLIDQQMKKVDPLQHHTLEDNFRTHIDATQGNGKTTTMNVKELTDFAWDKLYLFGPYTLHSQINERLGYIWTKNSLRLSDENSSLLIFVLNGKVVQYLDLSTWIRGDKNTIYTPDRGVIQFSNLRSDNNQMQTLIELIERSN